MTQTLNHDFVSFEINYNELWVLNNFIRIENYYILIMKIVNN